MKLGIVKSMGDCGSIYYRFYCYEFNKEVWEKEKNNVILNKDIKFCEYIEFSDLEVLKEDKGKGWKVYCDVDSINVIIIDNEKEEERCMEEFYDYLDELYEVC